MKRTTAYQKESETTSTEKLLDVIRNDEPSAVVEKIPLKKTFFKKTHKPSLRRWSIRKTEETVGIDIDSREMRLVRTISASDRRKIVKDYKIVTFPSAVPVNGPEFVNHVNKEIKSFCGESRDLRIWAALSPRGTELKYLKVPKVPRKQLSNYIFWAFKKEASFNESESIFSFDVLEEISEGGVKKAVVLGFAVPKWEVASVKQAFEQAGLPLTGISLYPIAFQNLFRRGWVNPRGGTFCVVSIGIEETAISIFQSNGHLVLSRTIKSSLTSMIEEVRKSRKGFGAIGLLFGKGGDGGEGSSSEVPPSTFEKQKEALFHFLNTPAYGGTDGGTLDDEAVFEALVPALDRLSKQIRRTLNHFFKTFGNKAVGTILLCGQLGTSTRISKYLENQFDVPTRNLNELFEDSLSFSDQAGIQSLPLSQRNRMANAVGISLSDNEITPNFLFTQEDRERKERTTLIHWAVVFLCVLIVAAMAGIFQYQEVRLSRQRARVAELEGKLEAYQPPVDQEMILRALSDINARRRLLRRYISKNLPVAVIHEILRVTPPPIRLIDLMVDLGTVSEGGNLPRGKRVSIVGLIPETDHGRKVLSEYGIKLENSAFFQNATSRMEPGEDAGNGSGGRFALDLDLEPTIAFNGAE